MNIIKGRRAAPYKCVVYGPPGVGKTRFAVGVTDHARAAASPDVLLLDYDDGSNEIDVARVRACDSSKSWEDDLALCKSVCETPGPWKTIVIDTPAPIVEHASVLIRAKAKNAKSLAEIGYDQGFASLAAYWREYLFALDRAAVHGRNVWLVLHASTQKVKNPSLGDYDALLPNLHKYAWNETNAWAHGVFYASPVGGANDRRIYYTGERVLYTREGTGYTAKNRWEMPESMPIDPVLWERERLRFSRTPEEVRAAAIKLCPPELKETLDAVLLSDGDRLHALVETERTLEQKITELKVETRT